MLLIVMVGAVSASELTLDGTVHDARGVPVNDAFAYLFHAMDATRVEASGSFRFNAPTDADVLVVTSPRHLPVYHHVTRSGPFALDLLLEDLEEPRRSVLEPMTARLEPGLPLNGEGRVRFPFHVPPGAVGGSANVTWNATEVANLNSGDHAAASDVVMNVYVVHVATGQRFGPVSGTPPLEISLPGPLLRDHPGDYRLEVRPRFSVPAELELTTVIEIERGSWVSQIIEGLPPLIPHVPFSTGGSAVTPETMNVLHATFTNETRTSVSGVIEITEFGTRHSIQDALHATWMLEWTYGEIPFFVAYTQPAASTGSAYAFIGSCQGFASEDLCSYQYDIPYRIEDGAPGRIVFSVPKSTIPGASDGAVLDSPLARTFLSMRSFPLTRAEIEDSSLVVDVTKRGEPYVLGSERYLLDPVVLERVLTSASPTTNFPTYPILASLALAAMAGGVVHAVRRRREEKYVFLRILGQGANGVTHLARHKTLGKLVAVKVLAERFRDDAERTRRLVAEARLAARIRHPNVVDVYDVEHRGKGVSVVMEYVDGGSLADRLASEPVLPMEEALRIFRDVLAGLECIHAAGIVHRDVKPSNILLTRAGLAKLADFGVASSRLDSTIESDGPIGTPLYMAPEQARGAPASPAADLYAATAVLYRCVTGRAPVEIPCTDPWEFLLLRQGAAPALPVRGLPAWMNELFAQGLAENPDARFVGARHVRVLVEARLGKNPPSAATEATVRGTP